MPIEGSRRRTDVIAPNLGLFLGRPSINIPKRGMRDCLNVRLRNQAVVRDNLGWTTFPEGETPINLDGKPVLMIDNHLPRAGGQFLLFANTTDLFEFREGPQDVAYLTPRYETGTVAVTNGSAVVTGTGTAWDDELKAGDFVHIGATGQRELTATWYEVQSVDSATQITLTTNYAGATDTGLAYTARVTFTASLGDAWSTEEFFSGTDLTVGADGDRWYGTNGVDKVVAWEAGTDQAYFPNLGDVQTVQSLINNQNVMMYIGIRANGDARPFSVRTSAIGQPENTVTLEASEFIVHGLSDALLTAVSIGDSVALYGSRSITLTQFVGPPLMFVFRKVVEGVGLRSARSVADFGDHHKFIGPDAQYIFDGVTVTMTNNHVWQQAIRNMSPQRLDMLHAAFVEEEGELVWVTPLNSDADPAEGSPEKAFVEHYLEETGEGSAEDPRFAPHTKRDFPATATGFFERVNTLTWDQMEGTWEQQNFRWNDSFLQGAFPMVIFGDTAGNIFVYGAADTANGTAMLSFVRFPRIPIGGVAQKGIVRRVYPFVETLPAATHDLAVIVRTFDQALGDQKRAKQLDFDLTQSTSRHFVTPLVEARYAEIEFRTQGAGHIWTLGGYDIDVVRGGRR